MGDLSASIRLSKKHNGRPRCVPVWIGRTGSSARIRPGLWARRGRSAATRRTARMWVRLTDRDLAASTLTRPARLSRRLRARSGARRPRGERIDRVQARQDAWATSKKISFYPPKEVMRLVAHAVNDQDAALFPDRRIHRPAGQRAARPAVGARSTSLARSCTSSAGSPTKAARTSLRATGFDPCR